MSKLKVLSLLLTFEDLRIVKDTRETVEKPRGVLSVKKTAFENAPGSTFSNRAL